MSNPDQPPESKTDGQASHDSDSDNTPFSDDMNDPTDNEDNIFADVVDEYIFEDRDTLQEEYTPQEIHERQEQEDKLKRRFVPFIQGKGSLPSAILMGDPGTGKTLLSKHIAQQCKQMVGADRFEYIYVSCADCTTEYQVAVRVGNDILDETIAPRGYPKEQVVDRMFSAIDEVGVGHVLLILDDVGRVESLNDILYRITRDQTDTDIGVITSANDLKYNRNMEERVQSSLSYEDNIRFSPYASGELYTILNARAGKAFKDGGITDELLNLSAAISARKGGDARYGLQLLLRAGELASTDDNARVMEEHIRQAEHLIDKSRIEKVTTGLKERAQLLLGIIAGYQIDPDIEKDPFGSNLDKTHKEVAVENDFQTYPNTKIYDKFPHFEVRGLTKSYDKGRGTIHELVYPPERYLEAIPSSITMELIGEGEFIDPAHLSEPNDLNY